MAERYGKYPHEVMRELTAEQIAEHIANDMLKDKETYERLEKDVSVPEDTSEQLMSFLKSRAPSANQ